MRRDWELVRKILAAIGRDGVTDTQGLMGAVIADRATINYHVALLCSNGVQMLTGHHDSAWGGGMGPQGQPAWSRLELTWTGNDFLDAAEDERTWRKMKKAFFNHAPTILVSALKTAGNLAATAAVGAILLEDQKPGPVGRAKPGPTAKKRR